MNVGELKRILENCDDNSLVYLEWPIGEGIYSISMILGGRREGKDALILFGGDEANG